MSDSRDETAERPTGVAVWRAPNRSLPLFVTGQLREREFVQQLVEHPVRLVAGCLHGCRRVESPSELELLVADEDAAVQGYFVEGLLPHDFERLDAYSGVGEGLYRRVELSRTKNLPEEQGEGVLASDPAYAYIATDKTLRRRT